MNASTRSSKYAVLSGRDLHKGTTRWFHSYLWGRFTQPTAIAWSRDSDSRELVLECLATAIRTFLNRTLPRLPASGSVKVLWRQGLQLSYGAELRAEKPGRAGELTESGAHYYEEATRLLAASPGRCAAHRASCCRCCACSRPCSPSGRPRLHRLETGTPLRSAHRDPRTGAAPAADLHLGPFLTALPPWYISLAG
jgi:hypothetical protein